MVGLVSYGTYIPKSRIRVEDIALAWKKEPGDVQRSLGLSEKSVPAADEDAVTIAVEAAQRCFLWTDRKPSDIDVLFVGSESHPYAVNPTSTIVAELLGVGNNYLASDLEFACKAATAGMQATAGLLAAHRASYGLVIGADTAQSKPHDALEYTSAAAGAAVLLGKSDCIAHLLDFTSYSSDTPDFWRRDGIEYPSHAGRFTGEPAYFAHVLGASKVLMEKTRVTAREVNYCVFHMPNGKFPRDAARRLGFRPEQLAPSLTVDDIGNSYAASTLMGFAAVLDVARPGEKIFMVSYGSGAGSDAFLWKVTDQITRYRRHTRETVVKQIARKTYIDYVQYLKRTHKI